MADDKGQYQSVPAHTEPASHHVADPMLVHGKNRPMSNARKACLFIGSTTWLIGIGTILTVLVLYTLNIITIGPKSSSEFASSIRTQDLIAHLEEFEKIAQEHDNSRAVRFGYNASRDYVVSKLQEHKKLTVSIQQVDIPFCDQTGTPELHMLTPQALTFNAGVDFNALLYCASGDINGTVAWVRSFGCNDADWAGVPEGSVALTVSGSCNDYSKALMAEKYKAVGLLIMNIGGPGLSSNAVRTGSLRTPVSIPVFSTSYQEGIVINSTNPRAVVRMVAHMNNFMYSSSNVIAETTGGNPDEVIVVGSHLDSVEGGPGINDNGSGSSTNLELALQIAEQVDVVSKVRFLWFTAEEMGLKGARAYVASLSPEEKAKIKVMINMDMVASPNFFRGVYDGKMAGPDIRAQSTTVTDLFAKYFNRHKLDWNLTPFDGRSDYGPFIENGVPAGGLFTGAEQKKTPDDWDKYGGLTNSAFDSCYHHACDTLANLNKRVFSQMARSCAYVTHVLATSENITQLLADGPDDDDD